MSSKVPLRDVVVCLGEPAGGNPLLSALVGGPRILVLAAVMRGAMAGATLWHVPPEGEPRRLTGEDILEWERAAP